MSSRGTWLALAVVAAIAVAAAADALRGDGTAETPAAEDPPPATTTSVADGEPAEGALAGVLYFTDESCRLRAVRLPDLEAVEAPGWSECRFVLSPDGTRASGEGSGWDHRSDPRIGRLFQNENGTISVATDFGPEREPFPGRAPAWHPDGILTYVDDEAVRTWPAGEIVVATVDAAAAIRSHPSVPDGERPGPVRIEEIAWLDRERLAAIVRTSAGGEGQALVAIFDGSSLVGLNLGGPGLSDLVVSPAGRFFAARTTNGVLVFDRVGGTLPLPPLNGPTSVAFAPDESRVAVATASGARVVALDGDTSDVVALPLVARDLAWRGPAAAGGLADAETRAKLADLGATGRLVVAEPGCRLRELRLPDLEWSGVPDAPPLCRFTLAPDGSALRETTTKRGGLTTFCRGNRLDVYEAGSRIAALRGACRVAWTPDGRLTFVRGGELWEGLAEPRRLVSHATLRRLFGAEAELEEVAWLDDARLWAAVRTDGGILLAAMTESSLVFSPAFTARRIDGLQVSRTGMVAARTDRGVVIFDAGGRRALTFPDGREVAWAPSSLVAAIAANDELLFVAPISRDVVSVPLQASDLEWAPP